MRIRNISLIGLLMLVVVFSADADRRRMMLKLRPAGGGKVSFSDSFTGNNQALSANWTLAIGLITNLANTANAPTTFDFSHKAAIYTGATLTTAEQYAKITLPAQATGVRPGIIFRYTDASSAFYELRFGSDLGTIYWIHWASVGGAETTVQALLHTTTFPFTFGITLSGTGNSTVVRVWDSPTADAPDSATSWDSGAEDASLTDNPVSAVDSGVRMGIGGIGAAGELIWDDLFAGDIP